VLDPCDIKAENGVLCDVVQFDVGAPRNYTFFAYGQAEGGTEKFSDQIRIQVVNLATSKVHDPYLYSFKAAIETPTFHSDEMTMTIPDNYTSDFMTYQSLHRFEYNASRYSLTILHRKEQDFINIKLLKDDRIKVQVLVKELIVNRIEECVFKLKLQDRQSERYSVVPISVKFKLPPVPM